MMSPERWQQIDEVLERALDLAPESRAAFLAEVCAGNASLHQEVLALLAANDNAGSFIEKPPATAMAEVMGNKQADDDQTGKLEGQALGHYQILSLIGKGGMGEVYLAQDTRLGRKLALKLLPKSFTQDADRVRRFQQEARTASALNHPNIITVYDIGQFDGLHFIATEFIEGETMRGLLGRKDVSRESLLELMTQVADGLAKAHSANIVHRDLKPDNVMRTRDGFAKVLDFGLAKLVEPQAASSDPTATVATLLMEQTKPGVVMGTLGYMSPEQAQGKEVDPRTDIFSFGCMLYEIVTGRRPFEGTSLPEVVHKIVYEPAPPITDFNPQCPAELQRIIRKCLNKDPEKRYQSVKDIAIDLRDLNEIGETAHVGSAPRTTVQQNAVENETLKMSAVTTSEVERELSDDDPAVQKTVRFSRASILLVIAGILGFLSIGPAYRRASIDSELKLAFSKDVAINKARESISSLGYNPSGLVSLALIDDTDLNLPQVAVQQGVAEARRAVRTGEAYVWMVIFKYPNSLITNNPYAAQELFDPKQGEFLVTLSPQGRIVSFKTKAQDDASTNEASKEEVVALASDAVRRLLTVDLSGYAIDFSRRSKPPGMAEVVWRAPQPLLAHQEIIRTELQGKQIIKLSRNFEPLAKKYTTGGISIGPLSFIISILFFLAGGLASIVFLIKSKAKGAFTSVLPIVATLLSLLAIGGMFYAMVDLFGWSILGIVVIFSVILGIPAFILFAGGFSLVRTSNPARLYGMKRLIQGRLFAPSAAASLVHGLLGAATLVGITGCLNIAIAIAHGYLPQALGQTQLIFNFGLFPIVLFAISGSLVSTIMLAVAVEMVEKNLKSKLLQFLIPVSVITISGLALRQASLAVMALTFASVLLTTVVILFLYRTRGFAAAWLSSTFSVILIQAAVFRHVEEPSFTWQANWLLVIYFALLAIGVWGYVGNWVIGKFRTIEMG